MAGFRTRRVDIDGDSFLLRELSTASVEAAGTCDGPTREGSALIAFSLCNDEGERLYPVADMAAGLAYVMDLPIRVTAQLTEELTALNAASIDDARKN